MVMAKLIIFDLDGTLIDAYPAIEESFNYTMRQLGYRVQDSLTIRRSVGHGDENLLRPFIRPKDLKRALAVYRRHHQKALLRGARLFPKVKTMLSRLKSRGYLLAVASNRPTKFSHILIRHLKIASCFDEVLCADKLETRKPHPEILRKIMRALCCSPAQTIYVGDMAIDIQAGSRARVRTVAVATGSSSRKELSQERPWRLVKRVSSLMPLLGLA
jgi:phosphoglycolate phosphatase